MNVPINPARALLDVALPDNDSGADTVRGYLAALIKVAWEEKRPFGNSGWHYDLFEPMAKAGLIECTFDEDGYIDGFPAAEQRRAVALIFSAIDEMGKPSAPEASA